MSALFMQLNSIKPRALPCLTYGGENALLGEQMEDDRKQQRNGIYVMQRVIVHVKRKVATK
jgi:hypothetical protein